MAHMDKKLAKGYGGGMNTVKKVKTGKKSHGSHSLTSKFFTKQPKGGQA